MIPNPVRLFHITAIQNLAGICAAGELVSKNLGSAQGVTYQNIAHSGAQGARANKQVAVPPHGGIHDYVPFYFAPRSPMLSAIHAGRVDGCNLVQDEIIHFETTIDTAIADGVSFVFYDHNATLAYSQAFNDLQHLDKVAWALITQAPQLDGYCKYFHDKHDNPSLTDRRAKRQAEFLVYQRVPLARIQRIGVANAARADQVRAVLATADVKLKVEVKTDWYFLNQ